MKKRIMKQMQLGRGFTLIELLVALTIMGILIAAGVPGMQLLLGNMAIRSNTDQLITSLAYSRGEAVARVTNVSIASRAGGNNWSTGWQVFIDINGDCAINGADQVLRQVDSSSDNVTITATTNPVACISFNRLGENAAGIRRGFSVAHANGTTKNITVSNIGYASVD